MCGDFMLGGADTFTYLLTIFSTKNIVWLSTILVEKGEIFLMSGCKVTNKGSAVTIRGFGPSILFWIHEYLVIL